MKYRLMDILACPMCKYFPLSLRVFSAEERYNPKEFRKCELFCGYHGNLVEELGHEPDCRSCWRFEVVDGLLTCPKCKRWYPIFDEIPIMLPDGLRDRKLEADFVKKWRDRLPREIVESVG